MAIIGIDECTIFPEAVVNYNESSLVNSQIFNIFNNSTGGVVDKAKKLISQGKDISNEDIQFQYMKIKQYATSFGKASIIAYDQRILHLIYSEIPEQNLSTAIPFLTFKKGTDYVTYIFLGPYAGTDRNGNITINETTLNILMQGAYAANRIKTHPERVHTNPYLQNITMEIYTKMIMRILLREYGFGSEKEIVDIIEYYIHRFFLEKVFESREGEENIELLSKANFRYVDDMKYNEIKDAYNSANINKFEDLLNLIKTSLSRMEDLTLKLFTDKFIQTYYAPALLAIDNFEYLVFVIIAMLNGAGSLINVKTKDIATEAKNIKMFSQELMKLI